MNFKLSFVLWAISFSVFANFKVTKPYAEYENVGYVLFHHKNYNHQEVNLKAQVLKTLPPEVDAVFIVDNYNRSKEATLRQTFSEYIDADRIKIIQAPYSSTRMRWNRDHAPIPVHIVNEETGEEGIGLVDHYYFGRTEIDTYISTFFDLPIVQIHRKAFEGGNFLADTDGKCFVQNNGRVKITDAEFTAWYGCSKVVWFPNKGFVGHIDERMKIIRDGVAVTDELDYKEILEREGYEVHMLPKARGYRTYANSLLINDVVVLPVFGEAADTEAIIAYERLGLEVHPVRGENMSDYLKGNVHCISMLYPDLI